MAQEAKALVPAAVPQPPAAEVLTQHEIRLAHAIGTVLIGMEEEESGQRVEWGQVRAYVERVLRGEEEIGELLAALARRAYLEYREDDRQLSQSPGQEHLSIDQLYAQSPFRIARDMVLDLLEEGDVPGIFYRTVMKSLAKKDSLLEQVAERDDQHMEDFEYVVREVTDVVGDYPYDDPGDVADAIMADVGGDYVDLKEGIERLRAMESIDEAEHVRAMFARACVHRGSSR